MAGETDQLEKQTDDNTGVGRSHECSYCKRGFTNAQALGGHMNIHRKEKATKAKRKPPHEDFTTHKYFAAILSEQRLHGFRAANPSYLRAACNQFDLKKDNIVGRLHEYHMMEYPLSLKIGPSFHLEDHVAGVGERKTNILMMDAEIDLELRLGQHP